MIKMFQKSASIMFAAFLPIVILLTVIIMTVLHSRVIGVSKPASYDLKDGWYSQDGEEVSIDKLDKGNVIISHSLSDIDTDERDLCFKTTNADVRVLYDGDAAYEYKFVPKSQIFGKSYGMRVNLIAIPYDASSVTIELEPLYENTAAGVSLVTIEESGAFLNDLYQRELPGFALCVLISLYGVMMLGIGILNKNNSESNSIDFFSLGAFSILIGIYSVNETFVLQLFTERPDVVRFCAAVALMFISYFPVSFVASVTHQRNTVFLPILFAYDFLNFTVTMVLSLLGISDVALMLTLSHIGIAVAVFMTFYLMRKAIKKKTDKSKLLRTVVIGMSCAMIGAGLDLLRFLVVANRVFGNSFFTRVGVLVFVVLMGIHLMRERTRLAVEKERSKLMETLAYTDGLTGLKNRLAFHQAENEIQNGRLGCIVIQLDINDLKKVNDVYGHAEGDSHIIEAVKLINNCFSDIGTCYRTGGDEFIVIARDSDEVVVTKALSALESQSADYNEKNSPPIPMQIAYGYAVYMAQSDAFEEAERLADKRMYEKKKQMKVAYVLKHQGQV